MNCKICTNDSWKFIGKIPDVRYGTKNNLFDVSQCVNCHTMVTKKNNALVNPWGYYSDEYGAFKASTIYQRKIISRKSYLQKIPYVATSRNSWIETVNSELPKRVLEVGCGTGRVLRYLKEELGWQVTGIEPNKKAADIARASGLQIHIGTLNDFFEDGQFDIILMIHVLEHLTDPLDSLIKARSLLKSGGKVVIALPNAESIERKIFNINWDGWDIPRHVHHFSPHSLLAVVSKAKFTPDILKYEVYSLLSRSLANKYYYHLPYGKRKNHFCFSLIEDIWGVSLAILKKSSAIQLVASR